MSQSSTNGARGFTYYGNRAGYAPPPATNPTSMNNTGRYPTSAPGNTLVPMLRRPTLNQHPGLVTFYGAPAAAITKPSGTQVPYHHHHQGIQPCAVHVNDPHRGAPGGRPCPRHETPVIFTHDPRQPVNYSAVHTCHGGQPYAALHNHSAITPAVYRHEPPRQLPPVTFQPAQTHIPNAHLHPNPSVSTYTRQPNWHPAVPPPQESPPPYTESAVSPSAASIPSPSSFGGAPSPPASSPPPKEKRQRETSPPTEISCPFPKCRGKPGRRQELERHVCQHLPHFLYCTQPECHYTANRQYALTNHYKTKHPGVPFVGEHAGRFTIYDAKVLVKQLLNKEMSVEQAESEAQTAFRKRGVELGKLGFWRQ